MEGDVNITCNCNRHGVIFFSKDHTSRPWWCFTIGWYRWGPVFGLCINQRTGQQGQMRMWTLSLGGRPFWDARRI